MSDPIMIAFYLFACISYNISKMVIVVILAKGKAYMKK